MTWCRVLVVKCNHYTLIIKETASLCTAFISANDNNVNIKHNNNKILKLKYVFHVQFLYFLKIPLQ